MPEALSMTYAELVLRLRDNPARLLEVAELMASLLDVEARLTEIREEKEIDDGQDSTRTVHGPGWGREVCGPEGEAGWEEGDH